MSKRFFLIIIIAFFLEAEVLGYFKIFGVKPDLILLSAIIPALYYTKTRQCLLLALSAGILKDALGINSFGVNTFLFPCWVILIIEVSKKISLDAGFIRVAIAAAVTILNNLAVGMILLLGARSLSALTYLHILLLQAVYTAVVSYPVFKFINPEISLNPKS